MKKIFLITLFSISFLAETASAQLFLEQGKIKLTVNASENISQSLMVHNTSDKPVKFRVYWQDFEYVSPYDGAKKFTAPGGVKNSASSWINFTPREFVLPPFGKKDISYVVNVPSVIEGGYYGVLFFEKDPEQNDAMRGLNIVTRVGCLFFIESADKKKVADLESIELDKGEFKAKFVNNGNVVLIPQGVFYIMSADGVAVDRGTAPNVYVPPGATSDYTAKIKEDLPEGKYTLIMTLDLDDGDSLVKEVDFEKNSYGQFNILDTR